MPLSLQADKSVSRAALTKTCSTQLGDPKGIYYWGRAPHRHHKSANSVLIEAFEGSTQRSCGALDGPEFQRANSSFSLYRHLVLQFILLYLISEISKSTTTEICQLLCPTPAHLWQWRSLPLHSTEKLALLPTQGEQALSCQPRSAKRVPFLKEKSNRSLEYTICHVKRLYERIPFSWGVGGTLGTLHGYVQLILDFLLQKRILLTFLHALNQPWFLPQKVVGRRELRKKYRWHAITGMSTVKYFDDVTSSHQLPASCMGLTFFW